MKKYLEFSQSEKFWRKYLKGFTNPAPLLKLFDSNKAPKNLYKLGENSIKLSGKNSIAIRKFIEEYYLDLESLVLGAWTILLYRYTGEKDIIIGSSQIRLRVTNGSLYDALPVRIFVSPEVLSIQFLRQVQEEHQEIQGYYGTSLKDILDWSISGSSLLFESALICKSTIKDDLSNQKINDGRLMENSSADENFPLELYVSKSDEIDLMFRFNPKFFKNNLIENMLCQMKEILMDVTQHPQKPIGQINVLTSKEQKMLTAWNNTQADFPDNKCIHHLFEEQVSKTPDAPAVLFEDKTLTYRQLNAKANQLANYLHKLGVGPETLIGLCIERSIEMIVGILGVLKAGGAYIPFDPTYPKARLNYMLVDSRTPVLLTQEKLLKQLEVAELQTVCLDTEWGKICQECEESPTSKVAPDNLAYMIYTSGSTGRPKGTLLQHQGLCNFVWEYIKTLKLGSGNRFLQFASISFDASVAEIFPTLASGATLYLIGRETAMAPAKLYEFLRDQAITVAILPPAILSLCQGRDLSALKSIVSAGESCSIEIVAKWAPGRHFFNGYGPTETTVGPTRYFVNAHTQTEENIPIGRPIPNMQVYILDSNLNQVPIGVPGELYIGGVGLARGYFKRPDLTAEKFVPNRFSEGPGARLYRTGDLARYRADGNIEFLGRIDHQVKIRGFRIETGEIEATLRGHPAVSDAVVVAQQDGLGNSRLVAYVVPDKTDKERHKVDSFIGQLHEYVGQKLPDYMVPSVFVKLDALPLTPNGKVDRKALPAPDMSRSDLLGDYVAPQTLLEKKIAEIMAEYLAIDRVGLRDNFFELGGHSLIATQIISQIWKTFNVDLSFSQLFESPTVAGMAASCEANRQKRKELTFPPIEPLPRNGPFPISFSQQQLWLLNKMEPDSISYNEPFTVHLSGPLNISTLEKSLNEMVRRHEILRTTFDVDKNEQPVQIIGEPSQFNLKVIDLMELPETLRQAEALKLATEEARNRFDLLRGPLMRFILVKVEAEEHKLFITIHHIITDGVSLLSIFLQELSTLYDAFTENKPSPLPEPSLQYADYAAWQRQWFQEATLKSQLDYWEKQLKGVSPLELPTDFPRPPLRSEVGARQYLKIPKSLTEELKSLSKREGVTLFITLVAVLKTLLYRYSGQDDFPIGSSTAGRNRHEIERLMGFFLNTLVLRTDLSGNPTFRELLQRVRKTTIEANTNSDVPYEQVVNRLQQDRNMSIDPYLQVMFVLEPPFQEIDKPWRISQLDIDIGVVKFDLTIELDERQDGIIGRCEYRTDLFRADTINQLLTHFQNLLEAVVANPQGRIGELPLLTETEREEILIGFNRIQREYANELCLHQLFEKQVERTPDAVAVVFENEQLTYRELNHRANQLAHYLQQLKVMPDTLVAMYLDRSLEMVISILAILKAGAAYLPVDTVYPKERLAFMLADSQAPVLLTQQSLSENLPEHDAHTIYVDSDWEVIAQEDIQNSVRSVSPNNVAYVIYTSGTTGKPKGCMITHHNVTRLFEATQEWYNFDKNDIWTLFHSYAFDFSVWELWGALIYGGRLVVVPYLTSRSPEQFYELLKQERVTVLNQTPSAFGQLIQVEERLGVTPDLALRLVIFGGEALELHSLEPWFERHGDQVPQLVNMYGITETTVHVTYRPITLSDLQNASGSVIGVPIPDLQLYILDRHLQPVPIGVSGEMYVGGAGLAKGYLNRHELTEERFILNPFNSTPGNRLYKTGDLARFLPNRDIEYLGRVDHQVKIRGFRIELGEIETVLDQHPDIQTAVVIVREDTPGDKRLIAYIKKQSADKVLSNGELRQYLQKKLPDYMIPAFFVKLDEFPLTRNGKIDRKRLPEPDTKGLEIDGRYMAPRTPIEKALAALWSEILGVERVGIHDNFFSLGGHSLLATKFVSRLRDRLQVELPMRRVFEAPTIAELAQLIDALCSISQSAQEEGKSAIILEQGEI
jgi:amino acid adenylation domain-containing protein